MQMQLKVLSGNHAGKLIAVSHDKFIVGRSDECHLRPKSDSISRKHCAIVRKDGKILLVDLKSRNGTLVNDKRLEPAKGKILKDGDHIRIGNLEFVAVIESKSGSIAPNAPKLTDENARDKSESVAESVSEIKSDEFDVSVWLEEADQIVRRGAESDSRQFHVNATVSEETILEASASVETQPDIDKPTTPPAKGKPGKLPPMPTKPGATNSKDAASETLRKFFSGGR